MEKRSIKELYVKVKDKNGEEAWFSMVEFSGMLIDEIGKEVVKIMRKLKDEDECKRLDEEEKIIKEAQKLQKESEEVVEEAKKLMFFN